MFIYIFLKQILMNKHIIWLPLHVTAGMATQPSNNLIRVIARPKWIGNSRAWWKICDKMQFSGFWRWRFMVIYDSCFWRFMIPQVSRDAFSRHRWNEENGPKNQNSRNKKQHQSNIYQNPFVVSFLFERFDEVWWGLPVCCAGEWSLYLWIHTIPWCGCSTCCLKPRLHVVLPKTGAMPRCLGLVLLVLIFMDFSALFKPVCFWERFGPWNHWFWKIIIGKSTRVFFPHGFVPNNFSPTNPTEFSSAWGSCWKPWKFRSLAMAMAAMHPMPLRSSIWTWPFLWQIWQIWRRKWNWPSCKHCKHCNHDQTPWHTCVLVDLLQFLKNGE